MTVSTPPGFCIDFLIGRCGFGVRWFLQAVRKHLWAELVLELKISTSSVDIFDFGEVFFDKPDLYR